MKFAFVYLFFGFLFLISGCYSGLDLVGTQTALTSAIASDGAATTTSVSTYTPDFISSATSEITSFPSPTTTPWAFDGFSGSSLDKNVWNTTYQCDSTDYSLRSNGFIQIALRENSPQCWLVARKPVDVEVARIIVSMKLMSDTPIDGWAALHTTCGNTVMEFQLTDESIAFSREGDTNESLYRNYETQDFYIQLRILWLANEKIFVEAFDTKSQSIISPLSGFISTRDCGEQPQEIWIGGFAKSGKFDILIDYFELAGP